MSIQALVYDSIINHILSKVVVHTGVSVRFSRGGTGQASWPATREVQARRACSSWSCGPRRKGHLSLASSAPSMEQASSPGLCSPRKLDAHPIPSTYLTLHFLRD